MYRQRLLTACVLLILVAPGFAAQATQLRPAEDLVDTTRSTLISDSHVDTQLDWRSYYLGRIDSRRQPGRDFGRFFDSQAFEITN